MLIVRFSTTEIYVTIRVKNTLERYVSTIRCKMSGTMNEIVLVFPFLLLLPASTMCLDVVVVGAGISGLSAGRALQQQGHRVTLLEADPHRYGGRIWTRTDLHPSETRMLFLFVVMLFGRWRIKDIISSLKVGVMSTFLKQIPDIDKILQNKRNARLYILPLGNLIIYSFLREQ